MEGAESGLGEQRASEKPRALEYQCIDRVTHCQISGLEYR